LKVTPHEILPTDSAKEIERLSGVEEQLRRDLAEACRRLRVERAATRPQKGLSGPVKLGLWTFFAFLAFSGWIRCLGVFQ
jgi:hypothetical protein